jgi:hypothetical protein
MALLDLQDMELPEVSGDPLMASFSNSDSNSHGGGSLLSVLGVCIL